MVAGSRFGALLVGVLIGAWLSSCMAYDFYVGDRHGWFPNPRESFNNWAGRNRFQVKDKIGIFYIFIFQFFFPIFFFLFVKQENSPNSFNIFKIT